MRFYSSMELDDLEENRDGKEEKKKKLNDTVTEHLLKKEEPKQKLQIL